MPVTQKKLKNSGILNDFRDGLLDTVKSKRERDSLFNSCLGKIVSIFNATITTRQLLKEDIAKKRLYFKKLEKISKGLKKMDKDLENGAADSNIAEHSRLLEIKRRVMEYYITERISIGHRIKDHDKDLLIMRLEDYFGMAKIKYRLAIIANLFIFFKLSEAFCAVENLRLYWPVRYKKGKNYTRYKVLSPRKGGQYKKDDKCADWEEDKKICKGENVCHKEYNNIKKRISRLRKSKENQASLEEKIKGLNKRFQLSPHDLLKFWYPKFSDDKIKEIYLKLISDSGFVEHIIPAVLPKK